MLFILDTAESNTIKLAICQKGQGCLSESINTDKGQLEDLLPGIDRFLGKQHLSLSDIKIIAVNEGPGTYTGLRIGITTANTLAWSQDIPIFEFHNISQEEIVDLSAEVYQKNQKFTKYVIPKYPKQL